MDMKQRNKGFVLLQDNYRRPQVRGLVMVLVAAGLLILSGCSAVPASGQKSGERSGAGISPGNPNQMVKAGFDALAGRKYQSALRLFEDAQKSAGDGSTVYRRALVGEMLIRLSADRKWRNLDRAAAALTELRSGGKRRGGDSIDQQMLMGALNHLLNAEKDNAELRGKLNASFAQLSRLEKEKENLSNALDKLRSLSLD